MFKMFYGRPRISLSYQTLNMSLFSERKITCSKIHLKIMQMALQKLHENFIPNIIQSIWPLVAYSLVMPAGLFIGCLLKRPTNFTTKMSKATLYIYIKYDIRWTVANGSLNPDLFFLDTVHLVEKGNQKLAK